VERRVRHDASETVRRYSVWDWIDSEEWSGEGLRVRRRWGFFSGVSRHFRAGLACVAPTALVCERGRGARRGQKKRGEIPSFF
jgi:hypothetical protein